MNPKGKLLKIEILSGGEWLKAQGTTFGHKKGWCSWKMRDGSQGLAGPDKWREPGQLTPASKEEIRKRIESVW